MRIDPWQAVRTRLDVEGEAFAAELPRLAELLARAGGGADWPVRFALGFGPDAEGRPLATGRVALRVRAVCQRCLGEVVMDLDAPIALALVRNQAEAEGLPGHLDPLEPDEGRIRPLDLVEDELLLAFPQVPRHPEGLCPELIGPPVVPEPAADQGDASPESASPFAVLAGLKGSASGP